MEIETLSFQIYTMYVNRKDLLTQAIQSLGPYASSVVVLDNSPKQDLVLDGVPGEVVTPSVPLFCSQSYNLILKMERGWAIAFASCGIEVRFLVADYTLLNLVNAGLQKVLLKRP